MPNDAPDAIVSAFAEFATSPRWVAWQTQDRGKGKPTKTPYDPKNGRLAKSNDPSTWGTRAQAEAWAAKLPKPYGEGGIGIMLGALVLPALGGADFDTCRNPLSGDVDGWALQALDHLQTYAEVSPSETGIKAFFSYDDKDLTNLRRIMGSETGKKWSRKSKSDHPPGIELYFSGRFFAVTDHSVSQDHPDIAFVETETLERLIEAAPELIAEDDPEPEPELIPRRPKAARGAQGGPQAARSGGGGGDTSRSAKAFGYACRVRREGGDYAAFLAAVEADPDTRAWAEEKGRLNGDRELRRAWDSAGDKVAAGEWLERCQRDRYGVPRPNLSNAMLALAHDGALGGLLGFDVMASAPVLHRPPPGAPDAPDAAYPRRLRDNDISAIQRHLQFVAFPTLSRDVAHQAVLAHAEERRFHPVRDYLDNLRWDGTPRVERWLSEFCGAEDTPYTRGIGAMFLVSMVARIYQPGCKADHMLVLEGAQNQGKSRACAVLGGPWFSDNLPSLSADDVRSSMALRAKWLIEIAEMHAMGRAEAAHLKAFISRQDERYTPKYGREEVTEPRQAVFIGTTNKAEYLQDETGGRRFWPVKVGNIDTNKLELSRNQLFSEAVQMFRDGRPWWPDRRFEAEFIKEQQEKRFEADAWEKTISEWLSNEQILKTTVSDVGQRALFINVGDLGTDKQRRISKILERLGWVRRRAGVARWWVPDLG